MRYGDFNAKLGSEPFESVVGKYGLGEKNSKGESLIEFCQQNNLTFANTLFQRPNRRPYTLKSPGDIVRKLID